MPQHCRLKLEHGTEAFYCGLHKLKQQTDPKDKLFILGDFNTRLGPDVELSKGVLGRHCKNNGRLLLEFCSEHQLITNTLFHEMDRFRATWRYPLSKHQHLDYTLTRQCDTRDILHTRVMSSADCCTEHRLIIGCYAAVTFTFKPLPGRKGPQSKKLQVH